MTLAPQTHLLLRPKGPGELKATFTEHLEATEKQVERLAQIFTELGVSPRGKKRKAMAEDGELSVIDVVLIAAQRVWDESRQSRKGKAAAPLMDKLAVGRPRGVPGTAAHLMLRVIGREPGRLWSAAGVGAVGEQIGHTPSDAELSTAALRVEAEKWKDQLLIQEFVLEMGRKRYCSATPAQHLHTVPSGVPPLTQSRDSVADVWGDRTPYHGDNQWPVRTDEHTTAEPVRCVQSCCVLYTNGCGLDIGVKDGRIAGVRGRADGCSWWCRTRS